MVARGLRVPVRRHEERFEGNGPLLHLNGDDVCMSIYIYLNFEELGCSVKHVFFFILEFTKLRQEDSFKAWSP